MNDEEDDASGAASGAADGLLQRGQLSVQLCQALPAVLLMLHQGHLTLHAGGQLPGQGIGGAAGGHLLTEP